MVDRQVEQPGADVGSLPEVELVVCAPKSGEDGGAVEGPVLHHMDLQAGSLLPLPHGRPLPGEEVAVHILGTKHFNGGVGQCLEPPEPADGKVGVEVAHRGEGVGIAEVDVGVAAVEGTHGGPGRGVLRGDVVVDPHPPAWVELTVWWPG